ncbi:putative membrane protein {ECO:0000313/EMBL:CEA12757,1} [Methanothermobacter wolfeii]|nr:putative membrane protein {ECO:0000313/EMBL:CEA12757,1} [Methanothermobacter wolfeii]
MWWHLSRWRCVNFHICPFYGAKKVGDKMRIRKTRSEREFDEVIDEYFTLGYKEEEKGEKSIRMIKPRYGGLLSHILILLLTWWTFGIGNILWAWYNYKKNSDKVLIKLVEEE